MTFFTHSYYFLHSVSVLTCLSLITLFVWIIKCQVGHNDLYKQSSREYLKHNFVCIKRKLHIQNCLLSLYYMETYNCFNCFVFCMSFWHSTNSLKLISNNKVKLTQTKQTEHKIKKSLKICFFFFTTSILYGRNFQHFG